MKELAKKMSPEKHLDENGFEAAFFDTHFLKYQRNRRLPHWEQDSVFYFITFRLWDSIPSEISKSIKHERELWHKKNKIVSKNDFALLNFEKRNEYYRLFSKRIKDLLDSGFGLCFLDKPKTNMIVENALKHFDNERYILDSWVIMSNHVHVLVRLLGDWTLDSVTHSWKSFSKEINKALKRSGQVWMHESFDHIIRNLDQLKKIRQYIKDNPIKFGKETASETLTIQHNHLGCERTKRKL
jgi:REP element-mobilizing transposase RayT